MILGRETSQPAQQQVQESLMHSVGAQWGADQPGEASGCISNVSREYSGRIGNVYTSPQGKKLVGLNPELGESGLNPPLPQAAWKSAKRKDGALLIAEVAGSREKFWQGRIYPLSLLSCQKKEMRLVEAHLFVTNSCLLLFITGCDYQLIYAQQVV